MLDNETGEIVGETDCCLGVACKLYRELGGDLQVKVSKAHARVEYGDHNEHAFLPDAVQHALGLTDNSGTVEFIGNDDPEFDDHDRVITDQLAELNDDYLGFAQIADLIESGLVETDDLNPQFVGGAR